jgi:hypothetical protein
MLQYILFVFSRAVLVIAGAAALASRPIYQNDFGALDRDHDWARRG